MPPLLTTKSRSTTPDVVSRTPATAEFTTIFLYPARNRFDAVPPVPLHAHNVLVPDARSVPAPASPEANYRWSAESIR